MLVHPLIARAGLVVLLLAGCSEQPPGGQDATDAAPVDGGPDGSGGGDAQPDAPEDTGMPDAQAEASLDAMVDADADAADAQQDTSIIEQALCPPEAQVGEGCMSLETNEHIAGLCDGLDNDCNGTIDDGCPCVPGEVQSCFAGPPGRVGVGACARGTQVCEGFEFPRWGRCQGGILPSDEQCDGIDNDCNGCTDEIEACANLVDCPLPGDPRIGSAKPFSTHTFNADAFVDPIFVDRYRWHVEGTPCDRMFKGLPGGANSFNGLLSHTLRNHTTARPELDVTLSGEYAVKLEVGLITGDTVTCDFPFNVGSQGIRVELCWPESGPNSPPSGEVDLDLHLGREGFTTEWNDADDCHWDNCQTLSTFNSPPGLWGAAPTPAVNCTGTGLSDVVNQYVNACPNPRLDIDSFSVPEDRFPTENINLDRVGNNQSYRVAVVNHEIGRIAHPLVNVYCDGKLAGSFRLAAGDVDSFGAGNSGDDASDPRDVWRVTDIQTQTSSAGLDCELTPLTNDAGTGPSIEAGPNYGTLPY